MFLFLVIGDTSSALGLILTLHSGVTPSNAQGIKGCLGLNQGQSWARQVKQVIPAVLWLWPQWYPLKIKIAYYLSSAWLTELVTWCARLRIFHSWWTHLVVPVDRHSEQVECPSMQELSFINSKNKKNSQGKTTIERRSQR